jgi:hypothetical protein
MSGRTRRTVSGVIRNSDGNRKLRTMLGNDAIGWVVDHAALPIARSSSWISVDAPKRTAR